MTRSLTLAVFLLSVMLANAQEPAPAANASFIAGTVVKEPGSEPLKKVLVQVVAEDQRAGRKLHAPRPTPTAISALRTSRPGVTGSSWRKPGLSR